MSCKKEILINKSISWFYIPYFTRFAYCTDRSKQWMHFLLPCSNIWRVLHFYLVNCFFKYFMLKDNSKLEKSIQNLLELVVYLLFCYVSSYCLAFWMFHHIKHIVIVHTYTAHISGGLFTVNIKSQMSNICQRLGLVQWVKINACR